jgi:hypothetical protein
MSRKPTPAKRLHVFAARHGLSLREFSPGLRIWTIYRAGETQSGKDLAFGIPQSQVQDKITEIHSSFSNHEKIEIAKRTSQIS